MVARDGHDDEVSWLLPYPQHPLRSETSSSEDWGPEE